MIYDFNLSLSHDLLGKHKHTSKCSPCQHSQFIDPQVVSQISSDPVAAFDKMPEGHRKLLNGLLYWANQRKEIYIRQDTLAKFAGYACRETANRIIAHFVEVGLISKLYRHKTSCLYKVSSFFNDIKIRSKLKRFMSQLGYIPLWLLVVDVTQYNSINLLISNRSISKTNKIINNTCARARSRGNFKKAEEVVMIKQYVDDIQKPAMTNQDKIQLSRYSEAAVRHALIQMQRQRDVRNPIGFLMTCAKSFDEKSSPSNSIEKKESLKPVVSSVWKKPDNSWMYDYYANEPGRPAHLSSSSFQAYEARELKYLRHLYGDPTIDLPPIDDTLSGEELFLIRRRMLKHLKDVLFKRVRDKDLANAKAASVGEKISHTPEQPVTSQSSSEYNEANPTNSPPRTVGDILSEYLKIN